MFALLSQINEEKIVVLIFLQCDVMKQVANGEKKGEGKKKTNEILHKDKCKTPFTLKKWNYSDRVRDSAWQTILN